MNGWAGELGRGEGPYQLMAELDPDAYAALKADIASRGVMVPIERDEHGAVLDGHHRVRACRELGLPDPPSVVRAGLSEGAKVEHVLKINLLRRHLGPIAWADAFRRLAEARGVRLERGARNDRTSATVAEVARELGVAPRTARHRIAVADQLTAHPDLAAQVDAGALEAKRAIRLVRERDAHSRRDETPTPALPATCDLRLGDFREVLADVPDGSVDLVLTDPPYIASTMHLYSDLGAFAARVLKPETGMLLALTGQAHLPEAIARLGEHLPYRWTITYQMTGAHSMMHGLGIWVGWKPVLLYGGTPKAAGRILYDAIAGGGRDKRYHDWGQSEQGFGSLLDALALPGALIVDPFVGGGTTAAAARARGLRFIGAEVDPDAYRRAADRLAAADDASRESQISQSARFAIVTLDRFVG